ncbi:MAG: glycosyltransferase family 2 protein [Limnochordia bacterium]|nr:glycosyltransferase family 2 protein [Limnochordia bacterium]MDD2629482.1 glycosyltransferase family 2 protein [Limnochordia bacterium]MDD4517363.1 glycosyltransferase family 2 protein [Limnochordia bacterium]
MLRIAKLHVVLYNVQDENMGDLRMCAKKVVALVPAYDEAPRIGVVLDVLTGHNRIDEVVVIDDGSADDTATVAGSYPVTVLRHEENLGKGAALQSGLDYAKDADIFLFLDADLIGLHQNHINMLLDGVLEESNQMSIGRFVKGFILVDLAQRYFPVLNGQRALTRAFIEMLPDLRPVRFGVEVLMNQAAQMYEAPYSYLDLYGISHWMKERKYGFRRGVKSRAQMYKEVLHMRRNYETYLSPGKTVSR